MADGLELIYDDESGTWSEAPETYGSIAFDTQEALEKAVNILNNYKWTSVDEALPVKEGAYLGVVDGEVREVNYSPKSKKLICVWSTCNAEGFVSLADNQVTHWQPMPELPEAIKG